MSSASYKTRAIVLRKTKLSEKDTIVSLLDETGALVRAVAKGARKPGGSYASRLELFTTVDLVCAKGRNLDIITSATIIESPRLTASDIEQVACCSALAELLAAIAQEELPHGRLFDMAKAAFTHISNSNPIPSLALTCSALLKALAYAGFRPVFDSCVLCSSPLDSQDASGFVSFAVSEGGYICSDCPVPPDSISVNVDTLNWSNALMRSRFDDVASFEPSAGSLFSVLQLIATWTRIHVGKNLKSIDFLFTCELF